MTLCRSQPIEDRICLYLQGPSVFPDTNLSDYPELTRFGTGIPSRVAWLFAQRSGRGTTMKKMAMAAALSVGVCLATMGGASAGALTGELWLVTDAQAGDAGTVPAGTPDANFTPGNIDYESGVTDYTIAGFLNHPTFSNESVAFSTGGGGTQTADDLFLRITGTIGLQSGDNAFVLGHDDGAVLTITGFGTVLDAPGPTSLSESPFNVNNPGAAGNFNFVLTYAECCGPPADLVFKINDVTVGGGGGVPEPTEWAMLLVGLFGIGSAARYVSRKNYMIAQA
jgi:hypothetical protein